MGDDIASLKISIQAMQIKSHLKARVKLAQTGGLLELGNITFVYKL